MPYTRDLKPGQVEVVNRSGTVLAVITIAEVEAWLTANNVKAEHRSYLCETNTYRLYVVPLWA